VFEGTLDESIREFMAKPESTRHLYKIHAVPQPPLITEVLLGSVFTNFGQVRFALWRRGCYGAAKWRDDPKRTFRYPARCTGGGVHVPSITAAFGQ
jgi:hypothetical protein